MLLDSLDAVAWRRLTCTYGTGEDAPGWLRQLLSSSPKVRRAALWQLSNAFVHQDTVWTAAVAAIPFLIELLRAPEVGGKDGILALLGDIADGYYTKYDAAAARGEEAGKDEIVEDWDKGNDEDEDEESESAIGGAHQPQISAIREGIPVYLTVLDDADPVVRIAAVYLLAQCDSV